MEVWITSWVFYKPDFCQTFAKWNESAEGLGVIKTFFMSPPIKKEVYSLDTTMTHGIG